MASHNACLFPRHEPWQPERGLHDVPMSPYVAQVESGFFMPACWDAEDTQPTPVSGRELGVPGLALGRWSVSERAAVGYPLVRGHWHTQTDRRPLRHTGAV